MRVINTETTTIRLGHPLNALRPSTHNGPGWRINIWTQGCSLLCTKKCLNPGFLDPKGGFVYTMVEIEEAIRAIIDSSPYEVEGITVLGGEPSDQLPSLIELLKLSHRLNLSTMVYTGFTLKTLRKKYESSLNSLLEYVDILIDGPFIASRYSPTLEWRGSTNQKIYCPTGRYKVSELNVEYQKRKKGFSIKVDSGMISVSGLQDITNFKSFEQI